MTNNSTLKGRTALVTGGAKGIGRACCVRLAEAGANVAVNFHSSAERAAETVDAVRSLGVNAIAVAADVSQPEHVRAMIERVRDDLGPVELLVNNAGRFDFVSFQETTPDLWRRTLDVNLTGVYNVTWAVLDEMVQRHYGRIVNVASISALRPRPMSIAYAVSKAGVVALTQSLSSAVAEYNIRINAVAPGLIETEIIAGVDQATRNRLIQETPIRRIGQPEEIANAVHFLLSDESSFTTGQTLVASGGRVTLP